MNITFSQHAYNKVNAQPEFTKQAREIMYAGMDFLRASQIISYLQTELNPGEQAMQLFVVKM